EDGIRDRNVTGVQTCALPISFSLLHASRYNDFFIEAELLDTEADAGTILFPSNRSRRLFFAAPRAVVSSTVLIASFIEAFACWRSEERRVGKECSEWCWRCRE